MLIIEVKKGNIEKALKDLKGKVIRTKQNSKLFGKKEFTKRSVENRSELNKAIYTQKLKSVND
jgi:ribosomal protein S21